MNENKGQSTTKKSNKKFIILGTIGIVVLGIILKTVIIGMGHETTNNAYLDAMITPIRSIVQGYVMEVNFVDNQKVKKGDTLIIIGDKDFVAKVAQAEAAVESAKAQMEMANYGVQTAQLNANASFSNSEAASENINAAQAKFSRNENELMRVEKMFQDDAATKQQLELVKSEFESSKAQLAMVKRQYSASSDQASSVKSQVNSQKSQINLASALLKQREAELILAKNQLENTIVTAPFDGVVSKKSIEVGQYLQASAPICSSVEIDHLWVNANFKETQIEKMRIGQMVDVKLDAFPKTKLSGRIQSIGGATGAKFSLLPPDNATGNFVKITQRVPVRIEITNIPIELKNLIIPGLSAVVDVHTK